MMEVSWKYVEEQGFVELTHADPVRNFTSHSIIQDSFRNFIEETGCSNLLIDFRAVMRNSSLTNIHHGSEDFFHSGSPHKVRIAFLVEPDEGKIEFLELILKNRGFIARAFTDRQTAVEWLTG